MSERIDTRGLSCPQPVVLVARAITAGAEAFEVLVDGGVSCENVRRFVQGKGWTIDQSESDDGVLFKIRK